MLTLENIKSHLSKISETEWNKLFSFIPIFENSTEIEFEKISEFLHLLYDMNLVVNFNWPDWNEGHAILNSGNFNEKFDVSTLIKLLTIIVRKDRFCEGLLEMECKGGAVVKILKLLQIKILAH